MGFVSTGLSSSLEMRMQERKGVKNKNYAWLCKWKGGDPFAHSVLGAIELLNLFSRPPKKPLTSVFDVFLRRRSAASFFPDSQELALLRYESRPGGGAPRSSSSEGDGWDFPEREQSREFKRTVSICFNALQGKFVQTLICNFNSMSLWCLWLKSLQTEHTEYKLFRWQTSPFF